MAYENENNGVGSLVCSLLEAEWRELYKKSNFIGIV